MQRLTPQQCIDKLIALGWTQQRIAEALHTRQSTISRIARGASPIYLLADALRDLLAAQQG